jgi:WD40 repeat protein
LSGDDSGTVRLWELPAHLFPSSLAPGEVRRFAGHSGIVWTVAYSPNGRHALSGGVDHSVCLWDVNTGKELRRFTEHEGGIVAVAFSRDGRLALSAAGDGSLFLWEVETGRKVRRFGEAPAPLYCAAFSPDDKLVLAGSRGVMILWDAQTGRELRRFKGHKDGIYSVAFSPDGRNVLSGGGGEIRDGKYPPDSDHVIRLWDLNSEKVERLEGHKSWVSQVAFSPDGRYALSGSYDGTTRLWDIQQRKQLRLFPHDGGIDSVAFSPDGRLALVAGGPNIWLWDIETGKRLEHFQGQGEKVRSICFSPDGRYALSGSWDGTVQLWRLPSSGSKSHDAGKAE